MGADVDVDVVQGGYDAFGDGGGGCLRWVVGAAAIDDGHLGVEEGFHGPVPVWGREHLIPAVRHLESFPGVRFRDLDVWRAVRAMRAQFPGPRPHRHDGFFEFCKDTVFLEGAE